MHAYGSLASYNVVDRSLHEITLETSYETMVLGSESELNFSFGDPDVKSVVSGLTTGFKYTRYLFVRTCHMQMILSTRASRHEVALNDKRYRAVFPKLCAVLTWETIVERLSVKPDSKIRRNPLRLLQVIDSTDASGFHHILGTLRLRYLIGDDIARLQTVDSIADIRLKWGGYFTHADYLEPNQRFHIKARSTLQVKLHDLKLDLSHGTTSEISEFLESPGLTEGSNNHANEFTEGYVHTTY